MIMTGFEGQQILFQAMRNQRHSKNPFNKKEILKAFKNDHKILSFQI